uniref:EF-hand domain-containing protein n=1 Tax=Lygus hesperus TaxID=30085 RepID=A0A0K8SJV0_LYGHE
MCALKALEVKEMDCPAPAVADVHETLHKIRAAANRVGFNLWDIFRTMEPPGKRVTALHKFLSVLGGPLKDIIGLGEKELRNLAAYFKVNDGRIAYDQFCRMVHNERPKGDEDEAVENPYTSNKLNVAEENRLLVLLTKIAVSCPKPLLLKPYFMDYELLKKNSGIVTRASFFRVLNFLGLQMSAFEHELLFDKYKCDNLSLKYAAFLNDLNNLRTLLRQQGYIDTGGRLYPVYDPTFPNAEASLLPRPEKPHEPGPGLKKVFQPGWKGQTAPEEYLQILDKIKVHVTQERIRVDEIFKSFDPRNLGRIRQEAFKNGLEFMRLAREKFTDMYLSEKEMDRLCYLYADPTDPERVVWQEFVNDIFDDLTPDQLAEWPPLQRERPLRSPASRLPYVPPKVVPDLYRDEDGFFEVLGKKALERKINLRKGFNKYDLERRGTVTEKIFEIAMNIMGFFFSQKEMSMIRAKNADNGGLINYEKLVGDMEVHSDLSHMDELSRLEAERRRAEDIEKGKEQMRRETNIVEVCAKIKKLLICNKKKMSDLIGRKDPEGRGLVTWETFKGCCDEAGLDLTDKELNTVHHVFKNDGGLLEYPLFTRVVDEHSVMTCLVRLPLKQEMLQRRAPKPPLQHDFVNFEDRICISQAMKILCKHITLGHIDMFKVMDTQGRGFVNRSQFLQLLHKLGILHLVTMRQIDSLIRGFGHSENHDSVLDYTAWLKAIDIVFCTEKAAMKL